MGRHWKARCDHHPWRHSATYNYKVTTSSLKMEMKTVTHYEWLCRLDVVKDSGKWSPDWHVATGTTSVFNNSCGPTALDILESTDSKEMTEQYRDWQAHGHQPSHVACVSEDLTCSRAKMRHYAGTKPRTSHHWPPGGERHGNKQRLLIYLEMLRQSHCQSDQHWNCFKSHFGNTSERQDDTDTTEEVFDGLSQDYSIRHYPELNQ